MCDRCWGYDALHPCLCGAGPGVPSDVVDTDEPTGPAATSRAVVYAGGGDEDR